MILSYELNHRDGRKSFPLVLVNWAPRSSEIGLLTLHTSAFLDFQAQARISIVAASATLRSASSARSCIIWFIIIAAQLLTSPSAG